MHSTDILAGFDSLAGANIRMTLAALVHNYDIAPAKETTAASMEAAGLFILGQSHFGCFIECTLY